MLSGRGKTLLLCVVVSVFRALYLKASEQFVSGGLQTFFPDSGLL